MHEISIGLRKWFDHKTIKLCSVNLQFATNIFTSQQGENYKIITFCGFITKIEQNWKLLLTFVFLLLLLEFSFSKTLLKISIESAKLKWNFVVSNGNSFSMFNRNRGRISTSCRLHQEEWFYNKLKGFLGYQVYYKVFILVMALLRILLFSYMWYQLFICDISMRNRL